MIEFMTEDQADRKKLSEKINEWTQDDRVHAPEPELTRNAIDEYIIFVNRGFRDEGIEEAKVKEGMERLTVVMEEVIKSASPDNRELRHNQDKLKRQVEAGLGVTASDSAVANKQDREFKNSFSTAANVFVIIQRQKYPEMKSVGEAVMETAGKINPQRELEEQKQPVRDFFFATAGALETMKRELHNELTFIGKEGGNYEYQ